MESPKAEHKPEPVSISPLLQRLAYPTRADIRVSAEDIASAFALIFEDRLSQIQTAALLTLLHSTGKDKEADVIAKCSHRMREAACQVDKASLRKAVKARGKREGQYEGGLVGYTESPAHIVNTNRFSSPVRHRRNRRRFAFHLQHLDDFFDYRIAPPDDRQAW